MALDSYTNLKAAILNFTPRKDVANLLDDFIDLTETDIYTGINGNPGLRIRDMETSAGITVTGRTGTIPTAFVEARSVIHVQGGKSKRIFSVAPQSQKITSGAGVPSNFAIRDGVEFDRTPNGTVTLEYYASEADLSTATAANAVLTRFPNIYLFGALAHLFGQGEDAEEEGKWRSKFESAILGANNQDRSGRYLAPAGKSRGSTP
jgi:hypothetical protein|tara:strand:- start:1910 stop:2527 length:618 start_codon:yes stop_codon:yes gene_type:complete